MNKEQEKQLRKAIKKAMDKTQQDIPSGRKEYLDRVYYAVEHDLKKALQTGNLDVPSVASRLSEILRKPSLTEEEWLTENDYDLITSTFIGHLRREMAANDVLAQAVNADTIQKIYIIDLDTNGIVHKTHEMAGEILDGVEFIRESLPQENARKHSVCSITTAPGSCSANYIPRTETENMLRGYIKEGKKLLLHSMGGVGKSELCQYLYHKYLRDSDWSNDIDCIGYILYNGDEDEAIYDSLLFEKSDDKDADSKHAWSILETTANQKKLLLIVDDIRPEKGEPIIDDLWLSKLETLPCSILVASRVEGGNVFKEIDLEFLTEDQCMELFQKIYCKSDPKSNHTENLNPADFKILRNIVNEHLGLHTLATSLVAGSALGNTWGLQELKQNLIDIGFDIGVIIRDKAKKVKKEERVSEQFSKLYQMVKLTSSERNILEAFSIFPPMPLGASTCLKWFKEDAQLQDDNFNNCMTRLSELSWLDRSRNIEIGEFQFSMHQIVASAIHTQCECSYTSHEGLVDACGDSLSLKEGEIFVKTLPYLPFAEAICTRYEEYQTEEIGELCGRIGYILDEAGNYSKALEWYEKDLAISEKVLGKEHPSTASTYNNIAVVYQAQGEYGKALEWCEKALAIFKTKLGATHPYTELVQENIDTLKSKT